VILILYLFSYVSHYALNAILVNAIKLIERTKRTRALFYIIKSHSNQPLKRNPPRRSFSRFKSNKNFQVSYNLIKRLAGNLVCIILVTFCPKASKHRHFVIRSSFIEFAPLTRTTLSLYKQNKALDKSPGTKAPKVRRRCGKDQRANCRNKKPKPDYKKVEID